MELHAFDEVADALHGMIPGDLGPWHCSAHRYGIKVWFGPRQPADKDGCEAQVLGARHVEGAEVLAVESASAPSIARRRTTRPPSLS